MNSRGNAAHHTRSIKTDSDCAELKSDEASPHESSVEGGGCLISADSCSSSDSGDGRYEFEVGKGQESGDSDADVVVIGDATVDTAAEADCTLESVDVSETCLFPRERGAIRAGI